MRCVSWGIRSERGPAASIDGGIGRWPRPSFRRGTAACRKRFSYRDLRTSRPARGREEGGMFQFGDLFQWERFITPSIIKIFYWLVLAVVALGGLRGLVEGLFLMRVNLVGGVLAILAALLMTQAGVIVARIAAEFVLITFRINEHLGAIRNQGDPQ